MSQERASKPLLQLNTNAVGAPLVDMAADPVNHVKERSNARMWNRNEGPMRAQPELMNPKANRPLKQIHQQPCSAKD
jgi:hypothetical protein